MVARALGEACDVIGPKPLLALGGAVIASGGIAAITVSEVAFVGGVIFGGAFQAVTLISIVSVEWCFRSCHLDLMGDDFLTRTFIITYRVLSLIAGIAVAAEITTWAGYAVTLYTGLGLAAATFVLECIFFRLFEIYWFCCTNPYINFYAQENVLRDARAPQH